MIAGMLWTDLIAWAFIGVGSFLLIVGGLGILRLPDIYTRLHAAGVTDTLATALLLVGMMFEGGVSLISVKLLMILLLMWMTSPVASHALAQSALFSGIKPKLHENRVKGDSLKRFPYAAEALDVDLESESQKGTDQ